jgi:ABC-type transport system involved in multi-copper enzyme maturation permease subunit
MMDILRSEWTKIRSVRSTMGTLAVTALLTVGLGALLSFASVSSANGPIPASDAIQSSLLGIMLASVSIATLGVLVISGEYRTGSIRTSFMAVPKRLRLLTGKIVVFTATALVVCTASAAAAVLVGFLIMHPAGVRTADVVQAIGGAGLYLTACGLFGLALGALVRHTPGAILSAVALILILPQLTQTLPGDWGRTVYNYFTTNAGIQVVQHTEGGPLGPWSGYGVYLAWIAVAMVAAAVLMRRRDA